MNLESPSKPKTLWVVLSIAIVVVLLMGSCSAGFLAGQTFAVTGNLPFVPIPGMRVSPQPSPGSEATPSGVDELFVPFWEAWNIVRERYVDQPVDQQALMRGAIKGMMEALGDEHSFYMDPEMFQRSTEELEGQEYEGIGAWVDTTQDYLTIISPIPGSPAEKAGLRPKDKIIAVDGEDMTGVDGETVRQRVIGPRGTTVKLTILREGSEPFDVEIVREKILVPTVTSRMLDERIAYIRLFTFGADTAPELEKALRELMAQQPVGLILDLRNNGGGYLDTAIDVVSQFIGEGIVMVEEYGDGRKVTFEAKQGGLATEIPLVILINEGSASAAEIVAGAVQDLGRGLLVGVVSFGKGSVQNHLPLSADQGAVSVTVARWLTPNGHQLHGDGLQPDYLVEITEADLSAGIDPQLQKAIDLLLQKK